MVDMRQIEVHITPEGLRYVDELAPVHWAQFQALAEALPHGDGHKPAAARPPLDAAFQRSKWP
jgi:hypothetical protein